MPGGCCLLVESVKAVEVEESVEAVVCCLLPVGEIGGSCTIGRIGQYCP